MPRLSVNLIARGKYWRAGDDIPEGELPHNLLKYVANETAEIQQQRNDADAVEGKPKPKLSSRRYLKRVTPSSVPTSGHARQLGFGHGCELSVSSWSG